MGISSFDPWSGESEPGAAPPETSEPLPPIVCWRCGKDVPADMARCPFCRAVLTSEPEPTPQESLSLETDIQSLTRLLGFFAALLGVSVVMGLVHHLADAAVPNRVVRPQEALTGVAVLEGIDTVLILVAWVWVGMRYREPRRSLGRRASVWLAAFPALALTLVLNLAYHRLLQQQFNVAPEAIQFGTGRFLVAWVLAICLQPAIVEELFFRYLMFGALRSVMGGHTVVWVTAVMFAAAHVGVPLSMPVLFVLGITLGYARLASGDIFLPMALHFIHNAVIMALNANRF